MNIAGIMASQTAMRQATLNANMRTKKEQEEREQLEEKQPSCHRHNMPNDKCYGKPYLRNGGILKRCHECKWFAFRSDRENEQ